VYACASGAARSGPEQAQLTAVTIRQLSNEEGRMAVSAYILIQTEVGKASNVVEEIRRLDGIVEADDVTGPYDVIVKAKADTMDELGKMVVSQVQLVEGLTRTLTCPVVNL
jgi:DNA-binding Lrp family transcriptional regulator